jgi:hypothetical protein
MCVSNPQHTAGAKPSRVGIPQVRGDPARAEYGIRRLRGAAAGRMMELPDARATP